MKNKKQEILKATNAIALFKGFLIFPLLFHLLCFPRMLVICGQLSGNDGKLFLNCRHQYATKLL